MALSPPPVGPTISTSAPICFSFIPSAFRFVSISGKYSHQRNVSDHLQFGMKCHLAGPVMATSP